MRLPFAAVAAATLTPTPDDGETRLDTPTSPVEQGHVDGPLGIGEPFGTRYRILRALGAGGMGVVYHAWDEVLGVAVALKVIRPEVMSDPASARDVEKRFKRELLLARQVTHRNVVRIHDLGELNGIKYLTMPFVGGQDLARIIRQSERLPVPRALAIAREIAAGLAAAHEAGVVHRDLKPENIMVEGEHHAQIMDFGISRSSRAAALAARPRGAGNVAAGFDDASVMAGMTMAGAVVGTVQYMAPEQARGQDVDHRADIYAFGLIFRDMLVGSRQHAGQSALDEMMARIQAAPAGPRAVDEQIPETLDRIITRCLEPDPAARYQSTQELVAELDRLDAEANLLPEPSRITRRQMVLASAIVVALLSTTWWLAKTRVPPPAPEPVSVLIADFENQTGDAVFQGSVEQALAVGLEGASFVNTFSRRDALRVAARIRPGSALNEETARLVSRREGIKVVVAGSIAPAGSGFQIAAKVVDPSRDEPLLEVTQRASTKAAILEAVGRLAARIRETLGDEPPEGGWSAAETFTAASLDAVHAYSTGQDLAARGRYDDSIAFYKRATEEDPNFGRAYAGWAASAFFLGRSKEAADLYKRAVSLVDRMTEREKYRTLGGYHFVVARNYHEAVNNYSALVERYPADFTGQNNLAIANFNLLNFSKALEHGQRALAIYPTNVIIRTNYALYAMYAGDFERAKAEAERVLALDESFYKAHLVIAVAAAANGDREAARAAYDKMKGTDPVGASVASLGLADLAIFEGRYAEAERLLQLGLAEDARAGNQASLAAKQVALAELYAATGRTARAVAAAQAALKVGRSLEIAVPAGVVLARAGRDADVRSLVAELQADLQPQSRAYARILEGTLALERRRYAEAVDAFRAAAELADLWLARFGLGVAYIDAGPQHAAEGLSAIEACAKRQGEATSAFLDDMPTLRYLSPLPYWLGRAKEGLGVADGARDNYRKFLASRSQTAEDALTKDALRRLGTN